MPTSVRSIRTARTGVVGVSDARSSYFYAVLRVVPRVERGESFNAGVVLFCRPKRFLGARVALDERKLRALDPGCNADLVHDYLEATVRVAAGEKGAGPVAQLDLSERFHWISSVSNTVIQPSPVHTGLTVDPEATLDRLFANLVLD
jgi:hypothetical protein